MAADDKAVTQVLPYGVGGIIAVWNVWYAKRRRAVGERIRAGGERPTAGAGTHVAAGRSIGLEVDGNPA